MAFVGGTGSLLERLKSWSGPPQKHRIYRTKVKNLGLWRSKAIPRATMMRTAWAAGRARRWVQINIKRRESMGKQEIEVEAFRGSGRRVRSRGLAGEGRLNKDLLAN